MPTKYRIAVTEDVYKALIELKVKWGLESPNQVIRALIERVTLSKSDGVTPSNSDRVTPSVNKNNELKAKKGLSKFIMG